MNGAGTSGGSTVSNAGSSGGGNHILAFCPEGAKQWCDGPLYCGWGQQTCVNFLGILVWGRCAETGTIPASPTNAFVTDCACMNSSQFTHQCCDPEHCAVTGERPVTDCGTGPGAFSRLTRFSACKPDETDPSTGFVCADLGRRGNILTQVCDAQRPCPKRSTCGVAAGSPLSVCIPLDTGLATTQSELAQ
jgi:hypothetical protein